MPVYPWPYPCPVCKGQMIVDIRIGEPKQGKTTKILSCDCGIEPVRIVGDTDLDHDRGVRGIPKERVNFYKRTHCIVCGLLLAGKQKKYCSNRCRVRAQRI